MKSPLLVLQAKLRGKAPSCICHAEGVWCSEVGRRLPALVAVSLGNIPNLALPEAIRTVYIAADNEGNEKAEAAAAKALGRAVARFRDAKERRVLIVRSSAGKDLNDRLMEV